MRVLQVTAGAFSPSKHIQLINGAIFVYVHAYMHVFDMCQHNSGIVGGSEQFMCMCMCIYMHVFDIMCQQNSGIVGGSWNQAL